VVLLPWEGTIIHCGSGPGLTKIIEDMDKYHVSDSTEKAAADWPYNRAILIFSRRRGPQGSILTTRTENNKFDNPTRFENTAGEATKAER
jgi:hypothetical protein